MRLSRWAMIQAEYSIDKKTTLSQINILPTFPLLLEYPFFSPVLECETSRLHCISCSDPKIHQKPPCRYLPTRHRFLAHIG
jgi:hypothetical protein